MEKHEKKTTTCDGIYMYIPSNTVSKPNDDCPTIIIVVTIHHDNCLN